MVENGQECLCCMINKKKMMFSNFYFEIPKDWCAEEDGDNLAIYHPNGNGAMTVSFYNVINIEYSIIEQMSIMIKKFTDQNKIAIRGPLVTFRKDENQLLVGSGIAYDGWYVKMWAVAKYPKIALVSYQSEIETNEVITCDAIIKSMGWKAL